MIRIRRGGRKNRDPHFRSTTLDNDTVHLILDELYLSRTFIPRGRIETAFHSIHHDFTRVSHRHLVGDIPIAFAMYFIQFKARH
jgi:hypothetical protein